VNTTGVAETAGLATEGVGELAVSAGGCIGGLLTSEAGGTFFVPQGQYSSERRLDRWDKMLTRQPVGSTSWILRAPVCGRYPRDYIRPICRQPGDGSKRYCSYRDSNCYFY